MISAWMCKSSLSAAAQGNDVWALDLKAAAGREQQTLLPSRLHVLPVSSSLPTDVPLQHHYEAGATQ